MHHIFNLTPLATYNDEHTLFLRLVPHRTVLRHRFTESIIPGKHIERPAGDHLLLALYHYGRHWLVTAELTRL